MGLTGGPVAPKRLRARRNRALPAAGSPRPAALQAREVVHTTSARNRLQAVLAGESPDRPPLCLWHHFRPQGSPAALAAATVAFFDDLGFDVYKVMPDIPYPPPSVPLTAGANWEALPRLSASPTGPLGGMSVAVSLVRRQRPDAVILATVFSPLALALRWTDGVAPLRQVSAAAPEAVRAGLATVADNVAETCAACLAAGADGIYFATAGLGDGLLDDDEYRMWGRPFDLRALDGCAAGWCNVLHMHGDSDLQWHRVADYPPPIFSWSDRRTGVSLAEIAHGLPDKTVMGGIDETGAVVRGDANGLKAEMEDAVRQTGGRQVILAGGCSVPDDIPLAHLRLARRIVGSWE